MRVCCTRSRSWQTPTTLSHPTCPSTISRGSRYISHYLFINITWWFYTRYYFSLSNVNMKNGVCLYYKTKLYWLKTFKKMLGTKNAYFLSTKVFFSDPDRNTGNNKKLKINKSIKYYSQKKWFTMLFIFQIINQRLLVQIHENQPKN